MGVAYKSSLPGECRGVEIFAVGTYKGYEWKLPDLDFFVKNTADLKAQGILHPPMMALGHDDDELNRQFVEKLMERTDLPKTGDVLNLRLIGDPRMQACGHYLAKIGCPDCEKNAVVVCDFLNVAPPIADIINRRAYDRVSAEIYNPLKYNGKNYGACLRAVSLLGGDLPAVKTLADIPMAVPMGLEASKEAAGVPSDNHTDSLPSDFPRACQVFVSKFTERAMDRAAMLSKLQELGMDTSQVGEGIPDVVLAEFIRLLAAGAAPKEGNPVEAGEGMSREKMMADINAMTDDQLKALLDKGKSAPPVTAAETHSDPKMTAALQAAQGRIAAIERMTAQRLADEQKAGFVSFSDRLKTQGVPPALFEDGEVLSFYMTLEGTKIQKFSDKTSLSQAEMFRKVLEKVVPIIKFSEKMKPSAKGGSGNDDAELDAHWEAHSDDLGKMTTKVEFKNAFKHAKEKDSGLTVAKFVSK